MITVAGMSPSLDLTYVVNALRLGEIHRPSATVRSAGGKSLNLARAARTLGADVHVVALLGGGTGRWLAEALRAKEIGVDVVDVAAETRTCVSIGATATGELTEVYPYAEPVDPADWARFAEQVVSRATERGGWLAISGLAPAGVDDGAVAALVRDAQERGVRVAIDTHGAALGPAVDAGPALTKINRVEAAELLTWSDDEHLTDMAEAVRARTGGTVVLTDGAAGSLGLDLSGAWLLPPAAHRGGFPVGSGDSFLGGLVARLDAGDALPDALRWAAACGTANALLPGTAEFDRAAAETEHAALEVVPV